MNDEVADLRDRLRRLEAEHEVLRTLHAYTTAHYNGDLALYLDCFMEDGEQVHEPGGGSLRGRAALGERFAANQHAPESFHKLVLVEPLTRFEDGLARVESDWLLVQDGPAGPFISHFGHYSDELEEGSDGRWRFRLRRVIREAMAPGPVAITRPPER